MKLISVNVSPVREVLDAGSRPVRTGIFKAPVDGAVSVDTLNLDGDDQADRRNHGGEHKAVYAFGQQHLPYWCETLARDDIGPGFFGENLSIDVLDERALFVGDRLRAGGVLLEITQPRVPCFKLGLRASDPSLPRAFVRYGLTGVYLRVLETGSLGVGDTVSIEPKGAMPFSLAELFAAVHDTRSTGRQMVFDAALATDALSGEWRELVEKNRSALVD